MYLKTFVLNTHSLFQKTQYRSAQKHFQMHPFKNDWCSWSLVACSPGIWKHSCFNAVCCEEAQCVSFHTNLYDVSALHAYLIPLSSCC